MANPAKPKHVKEAQGTLRKCRETDNPVTFEPLSEVPSVPETIPEQGRDYFRYCCELLLSIGLLTAAFIPDITRAAIWYAIMVRAAAHISEDDYFQKTQAGYTAINAHLTTLEKATKFLNEFEGKYGLNLVSSQKLSMPNKKKNEDDFD